MIRVGVDVGGTTVRVQLFSDDGSVRLEAPTEARGGESVWRRIGTLIDQVVAQSESLPPDSIGIGIPGQVDPAAGTVRHAVNLGIDGDPVAIAHPLADRFGVAVAIENDVRAAALGVHQHLRAGGDAVDDLVLVSIGTGISAGIIIDGKLHRGRRGLAGEIGHAPLADDHTPCRCGLLGCLEAVAAGPAIASGGPDRAADFFRSGGARAQRVASALARSLLVLATAYDPDLFVLGGGIGPHAAPAVRQSLVDMSADSPFAGVVLAPDRVVTLPIDADVGTVGAALLPHMPVVPDTSGTQQGGTQP